MKPRLYNVRYSVAPISSTLLTITLYTSVTAAQNIQSFSWRHNMFRLHLRLMLVDVRTLYDGYMGYRGICWSNWPYKLDHKHTVTCNNVRQYSMSIQWSDNPVTQVQSPDLSTPFQFFPQKTTMCRKSILFLSLGPSRPQVHQFRYSANLHLISHQTHAKQTVLLSYSLISRWFCANAFRSVTISCTLQGRCRSIHSVPALWTPCTNELTYLFHYSLFTAEVLRQPLPGSNPRTGAPHAAT